MRCARCLEALAAVKRPPTGEGLCVACFTEEFENEVHQVIQKYSLITAGDRIAVGVSGGKDSSALLHCLWRLKNRYEYDAEIVMVAIDEGIQGYRDDSLLCVELAQRRYGLPLAILSYRELYGWTMDDIVPVIGKKNNCTYCGVLRRQALTRGALRMGANKIATGHNADDSVETILLNLVRGDKNRLKRCSGVSTGKESKTADPSACHSDGCRSGSGTSGACDKFEDGTDANARECTSAGAVQDIQRVKPFYFSYQKEIVMYCHFNKLDYFSTECLYSPNAFRGFVRNLVKEVEAVDPAAIRRALLLNDFLLQDGSHADQTDTKKDDLEAANNKRAGKKGGEKDFPGPTQMCDLCHFPTSSLRCQACTLISGLNSRSAS